MGKTRSTFPEWIYDGSPIADPLGKALDMGARRNLGHHSFVGRVLGDLAEHHIGKNFRTALAETHHRGGGFVAAGFNAQNCNRPVHARPT